MNRPNIILIILDTLRADHLSCYGYGRQTSPNLDSIAEHGFVYENFFSVAPWTVPSYASIFTGLYPSVHGVDIGNPFLSGSYVTLPEALKAVGYRTFCVSTNAWIGTQTNFDRGFDDFWKSWQLYQNQLDLKGWRLYSKFSTNEFSIKSFLDLVLSRRKWPNLVNSLYGMLIHKRYDYGARRAIHRAMSILKERPKQGDMPFFLNLNLLETHIKYKPPLGFRNRFLPPGVRYGQAKRVNQDPWKFLSGYEPMNEKDFEILRALYDAEIYYQDYRLGEFFRFLKENNVLDNTVLIVTSDHGENIGEHGLMDHQYSLYDTVIRVPFVLYSPQILGKGKTVESFVQSIDLFPALMKLTHMPVAEKLTPQLEAAQSLLPDDLADSPRTCVYSEYLHPQPKIEILERRFPDASFDKCDRALRSVRTDRYKFIWSSNGNHELYDLKSDPFESINLYYNDPQFALDMFKPLLDSQFDEYCNQRRADTTLDPATQRVLEGLGYI